MAASPEFELFGPLPCQALVYRAMRLKNWVDKEKHRVKPVAFLRRPADTDGLSVNPASTCTIDEVRSQLRDCFGVASLHTGRIRDIGLDVIPDDWKHANIVGVPHQADDLAEAERFAGLLAKQAKIQWLP